MLPTDKMEYVIYGFTFLFCIFIDSEYISVDQGTSFKLANKISNHFMTSTIREQAIT